MRYLRDFNGRCNEAKCWKEGFVIIMEFEVTSRCLRCFVKYFLYMGTCV